MSLSRCRVVLVRPHYPGNLGAAARVMRNFGLTDLVLVDPVTSVNDLEVRVQANKIDYVVNGTVVHSTPKTGMTAKTDGLVGIRVNHMLEVHIDNFAVVKQ